MSNKCRFCKKEFKREKTLFTHMCEKKRRWAQQDERPVRIAFIAWIEFMKSMKTPKRKPYVYEDFMNSSLYNAFVRYGHHLTNLNAVNPHDYTDYLIKHGIALNDWIKDYPYQSYMRSVLAKETPEKALERGLLVMEEWSIANNSDMTKFFSELNTNQAIYWISTGKLSPWLLFCSSKANDLFDRFSTEQQQMVNSFIDVPRWKAKIKKHKEEYDNIKQTLKEYNV